MRLLGLALRQFYLALALVMVASALFQPTPGLAAVGPSIITPANSGSSGTTICKNQIHALCATARCFMFDGIAYCTCNIKQGKSISLSFNYDSDKDICTVNAQGVHNGYMMSTYSLPSVLLSPNGNKAFYDCPGATASGAYAQCDGGFCFRSSQGQTFPGSDKPIRKDQIICSCPVTVAAPPAKIGYQIPGPYPCRRSFFKNCSSQYANTNTGSTIYSGAPTDFALLLTKKLYGYVPAFNTCSSPETATLP